MIKIARPRRTIQPPKQPRTPAELRSQSLSIVRRRAWFSLVSLMSAVPGRSNDRRNDLACNALVVGAHSHHSDEVHFEREIFHGGSLLAGRPLPLVTRGRAPVHLPGHWGTNRRLKGSGVRRIERIARSAMDHEGAGFTFVHTHQHGTAISAFQFNRRIRRFTAASGAGTTLRVFCRRAVIAATSSKFGNSA